MHVRTYGAGAAGKVLSLPERRWECAGGRTAPRLCCYTPRATQPRAVNPHKALWPATVELAKGDGGAGQSCEAPCSHPHCATASSSAGTTVGKTLLRQGTILRMTWTCTLSIFKLGLCHVIFLKIFPRASHFYSE